VSQRVRVHKDITGWFLTRLDYSGNNLVYKGHHADQDAGTSSDGYVIFKYGYNSSDQIISIQGPAAGSWDSRAALF